MSFSEKFLYRYRFRGGIFLIMTICEHVFSAKVVGLFSLGLANSLFPAFYIGVMAKRYNLYELLFENDRTCTVAMIAVLAYVLTNVCGIHYHGGIILFQYGFIIALLHCLHKYETEVKMLSYGV